MSAPGFFDARPLVDPADPAEARRFVKALGARISGSQVAIWIVVWVSLFFVGAPLLYAMPMGMGYAIDGMTGMLVAALITTVLIAGLIVLIVFGVRHTMATKNMAVYRLARFAAANSMQFLPRVENPPLPGMIYSRGSRRMSTEVIRGTEPRFVEFGNYQFTTSNGKHSTVHRWGYVAIKLDVPLPHIVLDALSDNTLGSDVAAGYSSDQRLSLEGDFDRYFSLFCPSGYEVDALYLFTPDVMARFIDNLARLNVEIVDDWMFFYTRREVSTLDPATWSWLFGAVGAMMTKLDQWARWRDDRLRTTAAPQVAAAAPTAGSATAPASALPFVAPSALLTPPPPGVALPGRRLRGRNPWVIVLVTLGVLFAITVLPIAIIVGLAFFMSLG